MVTKLERQGVKTNKTDVIQSSLQFCEGNGARSVVTEIIDRHYIEF